MTITDFSDQALRDELGEIVAEMLDGFIEVSIPDGMLPPADGHSGVTVESTVPIVGEARALLTIRVPGSVAVGLTAALTGEDPGELTIGDACETMAELTNVLGGSVKTLIEEETELAGPSAQAHDTGTLAALAEGVEVDHQLGIFEAQLSNDS